MLSNPQNPEPVSSKNDADPLLKGTPDFDGAEKYIVRRLETEMPNVGYHTIKHIRDVLHASMNIAEKENLSADDTRLLRIAVLFHDIGFIYTPKNHEQKGAEIAGEVLPAFGFTLNQIEIIAAMILATRVPQSPATLMEKIICDADLDYLGREDFYEIGAGLFNELKTVGVVNTEREWNLVQKTFLESHRFHTCFSQANRENAKNQRLKEIIAKLAV